MCGIIGYLATSENRPDFLNLWSCWNYSDTRGKDGAGLACYHDDGSIEIVKSGHQIRVCTQDTEFLKALQEVSDRKPRMMMLHVRKATIPAAKNGSGSKHTHPFWYEDVCIVHNGCIKNYAYLCRELGVAEVAVDSEVIPILFKKMDVFSDIANLQKAVDKLDGAFTIAAMQKGCERMILVTNTERPLELAFDSKNQILFFASEVNHLDDMFYSSMSEEAEIFGMKFSIIYDTEDTNPPWTCRVDKPTIFYFNMDGSSEKAPFIEKPKLFSNHSVAKASDLTQGVQLVDPYPEKSKRSDRVVADNQSKLLRFVNFLTGVGEMLWT